MSSTLSVIWTLFLNQPGANKGAFSVRNFTMLMKKNSRYRLTVTPDGSQNPNVAPQWATGRENPAMQMATSDAPSVFFYVALALVHHFWVCCWAARLGVIAGYTKQHPTSTMVAQAGQPSGWPVSICAGILTPVWVTTNYERENSGGGKDCQQMEVAIMAATPIPVYPQYRWLFLAVRRSDMSARPHREEVTAPDFISARRAIARDFIASFAGRLPVMEVHHG